jgi:plastocyanin
MSTDKEPQMHRLLQSVLITAAMVALAACSSGPSGRTTESSIDPDAVTIAARDLKFSTSAISAPADEPFQIAFDNQEGAPHNVAIYRDGSATEKVFGSDPFSGPAVVAYDVPPLAAGTYFFRCDVHPDMSGQLTVG